MGSSGRVNLTIPQSHAFPKTLVPLEMTSGLQSMNSACTAGRGYLSTCTAEQEAEENTDTALCGQCGKLCPSVPLVLWHIFRGLSCTHTSQHILGTGTCCQLAQGVSILASQWKSPVLPCQDELSGMHWTLEICPHEGKYRNHSRNLI